MASKTYRVVASDITDPVGVIADKIQELAHSIESKSYGDSSVAQDATTIMHLAADIKYAAERVRAVHRPINQRKVSE